MIESILSLVVVGADLLSRLLAGDVASGSGAYQFGGTVAVVFAVVMVAAGGHTLLKAAATRRG